MPRISPPRRSSEPPAGPPGGPTSSTGSSRQRPALTVSELSGLIKSVLVEGIPGKVRVVGEVSNFSERSHWFFSLKDATASLRCVCFASSARRVAVRMADGLQVVATGRIDYYDAQGSLQLYVDSIEPVGEGALELQLRRLIEELRGLGYFDTQRKKPLPPFPMRVAVVTSRSGAALQDVIDTASRRWPGCRLFLHDVRVQGADAAPEIAEAINTLSKQGESLGIDAIILTRGGGSIEDLWAFNERVVADAIFRCRLPIVAAIGHETDTTIAELVADLRCATPTQAAMSLIPDRRAIAQQIDQVTQRLTLVLRRRGREGEQRLRSALRHPALRTPERLVTEPARRVATLSRRLVDALTRRGKTDEARLSSLLKHPVFRRAERVVAPARLEITQLEHRLHQSLTPHLTVATQRVDSLARQLRAVGPAQVLERGYTVTLGPDGKAIRSATQARAGDALTTLLADGKVASVVAGSAPGPTPTSSATRFPVTKRKSRRSSGGPTLFE